MKEYKFKAEIIPSKTGKGGAFVKFPFNIEKVFGTKGRVPVVCNFEGIEYKGSLVKMGYECHVIGIKKDIRIALNKELHDIVEVTVYKDESERIANIHPSLNKELDSNPQLKQFYDKLSYTRKKEMFNLLDGAKKEITLQNRLDAIIKELKDGK